MGISFARPRFLILILQASMGSNIQLPRGKFATPQPHAEKLFPNYYSSFIILKAKQY